MDVEGLVTGGGNPDWAAAQRPATCSAPLIETLLAAGAQLRGKTITDELAFSLEGQNAYYGTPLNPRVPLRLPGGSSSGSASAVAGGAADFALGTDTGGSVRVPAAFCGLFGIRPTHGAVSLAGVIPFAPSYDTIGWFARDAATLLRVGTGLLSPGVPIVPRFLCAVDAFAMADETVRRALFCALPEALRTAQPVAVFDGDSDAWREAYRVLQGHEIWQSLGPWIIRASPRFGPEIATRFADAATITSEEVARWQPWRNAARRRLAALLGDDGILVLPTAPSIALLKTSTLDQRAAFYCAALPLTALAGHAGLPQVTLPLTKVDGAPVGLSLIGPAGADGTLLALARDLLGQT